MRKLRRRSAQACEGARFCPTSEILQGIEIRRKGEGQRHLHRAALLLETAQEQLRRSNLAIKQIVPAGDFRRKRGGGTIHVNLVYWSERDKGTVIAFIGGERDAVLVEERPEQILSGP